MATARALSTARRRNSHSRFAQMIGRRPNAAYTPAAWARAPSTTHAVASAGRRTRRAATPASTSAPESSLGHTNTVFTNMKPDAATIRMAGGNAPPGQSEGRRQRRETEHPGGLKRGARQFVADRPIPGQRFGQQHPARLERGAIRALPARVQQRLEVLAEVQLRRQDLRQQVVVADPVAVGDGGGALVEATVIERHSRHHDAERGGEHERTT